MRLVALLLLAAAGPAFAQPLEEVVVVKVGGHTIAGLVSRGPRAKPKHGIALFPGHPGILKLHEENGKPAFQQGGNFVIRSRRWWLDAQTLTVAMDAPSDQWTSFDQLFRQNARYGADVASRWAHSVSSNSGGGGSANGNGVGDGVGAGVGTAS